MSNRIALPRPLRVGMLGSVLQFMNGAGMDEHAIRETFEICMQNLHKRPSTPGQRRKGKLKIGNENVCAEILRMWHRDSRYIDSDAKPRPLPLNKGRNCLLSIARRVDGEVDAAQVLQEMRAVRLIRKTSHGRYLPNAEFAIVGRLHPLAIDHIAKLVIRLFGTVSRNMDPSGKSLKLFERQAYAPDLDWSERAAFAEFTRTQGVAYLESIANWLQQRRLCRSVSRTRQSRKQVAASVYAFAYLGDDEGTDLPRIPGPKARKSKAGSRPAPKSSSRTGKSTSAHVASA